MIINRWSRSHSALNQLEMISLPALQGAPSKRLELDFRPRADCPSVILASSSRHGGHIASLVS